jgi:hypothetical protein
MSSFGPALAGRRPATSAAPCAGRAKGVTFASYPVLMALRAVQFFEKAFFCKA